MVAIIQARMGSTRLPGKVMKDLGGVSVLGRVVRRSRRAKLLHEVVVATSVLPSDDVIVQECDRLSVACFRGDEADVLDRYYVAAQKFAAEIVVRITADCPLIDPELIDATVRAFFDQKSDYATNALVVTYPRGLDVEVFSAQALARAWSEAKLSYERVHVTPYFYEIEGRFRVGSVTAGADYSRHRWALDTVEDLELMRSVYARFDNSDDMSWLEVLSLMDREPQLALINSHVEQKVLQDG
ncbi:MAG TPA: glycosyltransferase family protein [Terriglobales bacterium]|nr:glycosyltransferase family protein [Terriglobales bacterium]